MIELITQILASCAVPVGLYRSLGLLMEGKDLGKIPAPREVPFVREKCIGYSEYLLFEALCTHDWDLAEYAYSPSTSRGMGTWKPLKKRSPLPPPPVSLPAGVKPAVDVNCLHVGLPSVMHFTLVNNVGAVQWLIDRGASVALLSNGPPHFNRPMNILQAVALSASFPIAKLLLSRFRFGEDFFKKTAFIRLRFFRQKGEDEWTAKYVSAEGISEHLNDWRTLQAFREHLHGPLVYQNSVTFWERRRLLYIARLKPNEDCRLASLPLDVLRKIDMHYRHDLSLQTLRQEPLYHNVEWMRVYLY